MRGRRGNRWCLCIDSIEGAKKQLVTKDLASEPTKGNTEAVQLEQGS